MPSTAMCGKPSMYFWDSRMTTKCCLIKALRMKFHHTKCCGPLDVTPVLYSIGLWFKLRPEAD